MAVVETLEVRFRADIGKFSAQLNQLAAKIHGIGNMLDGGKDSLTANAAGLIEGVAEALVNGAAISAAPVEAGARITDRFSQAILGGKSSAALAAARVSAAADFSGGGAAAKAAGAALSQGFANGIASHSAAVTAAVNRVVNAAVSRIRSALQIHSPSRVSFEMGGYFGEGFADGISASIRLAQQSVGALSAASAEMLNASGSVPAQAFDPAGLAGMVRSAVNDALGDTSIVVPLHVDGMKLGEASIRGINRVTRSAGRLMLEI